MESLIIRFYRSAGPDHAGRRLDEILAWDNGALEAVHDYIQWLFPLGEPSAFNPDAPVLSDLDCDGFKNDATLSANLRRAFARMLAFYGFRLVEREGRTAITRAEDWPLRSRGWMRPGNHNYLRLTRIMKSLTILGQPALARALGEQLASEYRAAPHLIGSTTLGFWRAATASDSQEL